MDKLKNVLASVIFDYFGDDVVWGETPFTRESPASIGQPLDGWKMVGTIRSIKADATALWGGFVPLSEAEDIVSGLIVVARVRNALHLSVAADGKKAGVVAIVRATLWVVDCPFDAETVSADVIEDGVVASVRDQLWVLDCPFDVATVAANVIKKEVGAIVRATLQRIDCPFDAETVTADVIDSLEWARIRAESDADPRFTRCPVCDNGNGACAC